MSPRRTDAERLAVQTQSAAYVAMREAVANYLAAFGVELPLAYAIGAQTHEAERFGHVMEEVFNHLDDVIDEIAELDAAETYRDVEAQIGGTE